jgi:ribosome-associated protein
LVVDALEDVKAQDIQVFDTTPMTTLFDRVVMASGTSNRQTRALAKSVHDKVREAGAPVLSIEGTDTGEWVLVDLGDMVVHIMQPITRDHYRLEDIWGEVSVSLDEITKPFRKKTPGKKASANTTTAAKPSSKKAPAKKPPTKVPEAKKPSMKKPAATSSATKAFATKKAPGKKPAAKKKADK